jgi:16S rRNA (guanine966-N2)-methyltransferase
MLKNEVRIIGGKFRGRKLKFSDVLGLRPTPDRVRETVFNWLSSRIIDARCLDLFAGSGALGFEALSRGAAEVVFVDRNEQIVQQLIKNKQLFQCDHAVIYQIDAFKYLGEATQPFDIVFLDPPFHQGFVDPCCRLLKERNLLKPNALIYIEVESVKRKTLTDVSKPFILFNDWVIIKQKRAGQVSYYLIQV